MNRALELLDSLEPWTRAKCEKVLAAAPIVVGLPVRITQARRSLDEQLHLWQQGRKIVGGVWVIVDPTRIVTKAKPGASAHNYGMAFDICFVSADPYLHEYEEHNAGAPDPRWQKYGQLVESVGLSWGGPLGENDKFGWDRPHAERPDWKTASGWK